MEQCAPGSLPYQCKECGWSFLSSDKLRRHVSTEHESKDPLVEYRCIPAEEPIGSESSGNRHEPPVKLHIRLNHINWDKCWRRKKSNRKRGCEGAIPKERKRRNRTLCRRCNLRFFSRTSFEQHLKSHVRKTDAVVRLVRLPISVEVLRNASKNCWRSPGESHPEGRRREMQESSGAMLRSMLVSDCDIRQRASSADSAVVSNTPYHVPERRLSASASSEAAVESFDRSLMAELNSHIKSLAESIMKGPKELSEVESRPTNILQAALKSGSHSQGPPEESTLSAILKSPLPKPAIYAGDGLTVAPPKYVSPPAYCSTTLSSATHVVPNFNGANSVLPSSSMTNGLPPMGLTITPTTSSTAPRTPVESRFRAGGQSSENGSRLCAILKSALVGAAPKSAPCLVPRPAPSSTSVERCNSVMIIENDSSQGLKTKARANASFGSAAVQPASNPSPLAMLSQLSSQTAVNHGVRREVPEAPLTRPASVIVLDSPSAEKHPGLSIQSVVSLAPDHAQELWGEASGPHVLQDRRSQCCCGVCRNVRDGNLLPKSEIKSANGRIEYYCPICRRRFTHKISLFRHCRSFGHAFVCDMCSCGFLDQATFEAHKKSIHLVNMCSPVLPGTSPATMAPRQRQRQAQAIVRPPPLVSAAASRANPPVSQTLSGEPGIVRRHKQALQPHPSPSLTPAKVNSVEDDDVIVVGIEPGRGRPSGTLPQPPPLKRRPVPSAGGPPVNRTAAQPLIAGTFARKTALSTNRVQKLPFSSSGVTLQRISGGESPADVASQPSQLARILRNSEITLTPIESRKPESTAASAVVSSPSTMTRAVLAPSGVRLTPSAPLGHRGEPFRQTPASSPQTAHPRTAVGPRQRMVLQPTKPVMVARGPTVTGSTTYRVHPVAPQLAKRTEASMLSFQAPKDAGRSLPVWHHPVPSESNRIVPTRTSPATSIAISQSSNLGDHPKIGPSIPAMAMRPPPLISTLPSCHQSHGPNKFPTTVTTPSESVFVPPPPPYLQPQAPLGSSPPSPPPYRPPNQVSRVTWALPPQPSVVALPSPLTGQVEPLPNGSAAVPPVQCNLCEMSFQTQFAFQAHFNLMHSNPQRQEYSCGRCQRSYNKPAPLKRHEMNCTEKVRCVKCNQLYYRNELLAHYSIDHFPGSGTSPIVDPAVLPAASEGPVVEGTAGSSPTVVDSAPMVVDDVVEISETVLGVAPVTSGDASHANPDVPSVAEGPETSTCHDGCPGPADSPVASTPVCGKVDSCEDRCSVVLAVLEELVKKVAHETDVVSSSDESDEAAIVTGECSTTDAAKDSPCACQVPEPVNRVVEPTSGIVDYVGDATSQGWPRTGECTMNLETSLMHIIAEDDADADPCDDDRFLRDSPESPEECIASPKDDREPVDPSPTFSPVAEIRADEQISEVERESSSVSEPIVEVDLHSEAEDVDANAVLGHGEDHIVGEDEAAEDSERDLFVGDGEAAVQVYPEREVTSDLSEELPKEEGEPSIVESKVCVCPICDQKFLSDRKFFRHIELHKDLSTHRCMHCEATFRSRKLLMSHFRTHLRSCRQPKAKRRRVGDHGANRHDPDHSRLVVALLDLKQVEANKEFLRRMGVVGLMTLENLREFFSQKPAASPCWPIVDGLGGVPMINLEDEGEEVQHHA